MYIILGLSVRQSSNGVRMYFNLVCDGWLGVKYNVLMYNVPDFPSDSASFRAFPMRRHPWPAPARSYGRGFIQTRIF